MNILLDTNIILNIVRARDYPENHAFYCFGRFHTTQDDEMENAMAVQSIKKFVYPKDIAVLAIFQASDSAKMISGQIIPIDRDMQQAS